MATQKAQVTLRGRFRAGTRVRLVEVKDESVLRAEGGKLLDVKRVDEDGQVRFTKDVKKGGRYFVVGNVDGQPLEVRARGNTAEEESAVLGQAPVQPDRVRLADGSFADETPERQKTPSREVQPAPRQDQVADGVVQRSDTPRGSAHPVDPEETLPYPRQEDVPDGVVQMSDTETGQATPIQSAVSMRQEDVPDNVVQRSSTATGVATPIPKGDAVRAQQEKESADAKAMRGEPVRAAAEPLDVAGAKSAGPEKVAQPRKRTTQRKTQRKATSRKSGSGKSTGSRGSSAKK